uniref:Charged multivesicular body protein 2A n=1 Tax=Tetraselmis sp. GSL018 TaxID=582737 RepID=A0A061R9N9_9CHLO
MEWLFGKKKTPAEMLRENKRMLDKAIRELERERTQLQNEEKKLITEIKKSAKQNQMDAVKIMAKSLVRNRHATTKMVQLKSQLQAVSIRLQTLKSSQAMGDAMRGATRAMGAMNKQMNLPKLQQIMREFERQNERMEMSSEMMGDAIDDAFEGEAEEEESDELVSQVMDELGITLSNELLKAPGQAVAQPAQPAAAAANEPMAEGIDDDLQARLNNLRRT